MNKIEYFVLDYYNRQVVNMIMEKYGLEQMDAVRAFITSETHLLLEDRQCQMTVYGPAGIFDIWEAEKVTGNPRNSIYIRGE